jgi:3-methyl-2-oxobutanoate hydroxymethyltransferase
MKPESFAAPLVERIPPVQHARMARQRPPVAARRKDDDHAPLRSRVTLRSLRDMHARRTPIAMLTAYDATFARLLDDAGADCLLIGDSLGMLVQGHGSTLTVTLDQMIYHTECVARANRSACLIADLPFSTFARDLREALRSSAALMQAGAQMVKLAGGGMTTETVQALTKAGVPVCAHLGLSARSVHAFGDDRMQASDESGAAMLLQRARELVQAGAAMLVLEKVPATLAATIESELSKVITIGIGAGSQVSGHLMATHDLLGMTSAGVPHFIRPFMGPAGTVQEAVRAYVAAVKAGSSPGECMHAQ